MNIVVVDCLEWDFWFVDEVYVVMVGLLLVW